MEINEGTLGKVLPLLLKMVLVESVLPSDDQENYRESWGTVYIWVGGVAWQGSDESHFSREVVNPHSPCRSFG